MASATTTSLPSASHIRLTFVSPANQTGIIAILTSFSLGLILLSTGVRLYAKRYAGVCRSDDVAFYLAVCFGLVQMAVVFFLVSQGWGKIVDLLSPEELRSIQRVSRSCKRAHWQELTRNCRAGLQAHCYISLCWRYRRHRVH